MFSLTDKEKDIYNLYLKYSRYGYAYRPRKDFSDMDQNTIVACKKIYNFLSKYPHIKYEDYFKAPLELHPEDKYPQLSFFTTLAASRLYSLFKKQEEDIDPEKQIDNIKEGFRFIGMFCLENNISIDQYPYHKTSYIMSWLDHYRQHYINPYCLMEIRGIFDVLCSLEEDEVELFAKNLSERFVSYKTRYSASKKTQTLVKEATNRVKNFLKNNLQTPKTMVI